MQYCQVAFEFRVKFYFFYLLLYKAFFLKKCGNNLYEKEYYLLGQGEGIETRWASGFKEEFFFAYMLQKTKVRSYKWKFTRNGYVEEFHFASINNTLTVSLLWKEETKRLKFKLFEIEYSVGVKQDFIHSYVKLIEKTSENTKINMTFLIVDDKSVEKSCRINKTIFKSSLV